MTAPTYTKFYKYALTGKAEAWGAGLSEIDPTKQVAYVCLDTDGYLLAVDGFDPTNYTNSTCTLTEITDSTELAACKKAIGISY
tara:strand:+ start:831 stop:1082 length:252 start_codon:yes stop_codon:yes gene_type:complete